MENESTPHRIAPTMPAYMTRAVESAPGDARGPWDAKVGDFLKKINEQRRHAGFPEMYEVTMRVHIGRYMKNWKVTSREMRLAELCALWSYCIDAEGRGKEFWQVFWGRMKSKPPTTQKLL